jgi:hypothetical protein
LPGSTRQSIIVKNLISKKMDLRVKPGVTHEGKSFEAVLGGKSFGMSCEPC